MCLACGNLGAQGKEQIKELFNFQPFGNMSVEQMKSIPGSFTGNILHTPNNDEITLTINQVEEICNNALVVIATGVDTRIDIWAIQWPTNYEVKTII